jgi:hypothetical protein
MPEIVKEYLQIPAGHSHGTRRSLGSLCYVTSSFDIVSYRGLSSLINDVDVAISRQVGQRRYLPHRWSH